MTQAASHPAGEGDPPLATYRFTLFVAGDEPNSRLAKENLARLCDSVPAHCCEVEIIDVLVDYRPALEHNILVTPCLLWHNAGSPVRVAGTLSDTQRVRAALGLPIE
jgi:circadian clock protein KaiB